MSEKSEFEKQIEKERQKHLKAVKEAKNIVDTLENISRKKTIHRVDKAIAEGYINRILKALRNDKTPHLKDIKEFITKIESS